jgi:uncharacterized membrane protein YqjE
MLEFLGVVAGLAVSLAFFPAMRIYVTSRIETMDEARGWIAILAYVCLILLLGLVFGWPR